MGNNATTVALQESPPNGNFKKNAKRKGKSNIITHGSCDQHKKKGHKKTGMIPDPDYVGGEGDSRFSQDGLVIPKKPPNPCLESSERQNLHRELLFNQKMGKSVIGQKSELAKAFERLRDEHKKKELEEEKLAAKTALQRKLEEQADKLKRQEELSTPSPTPEQPEFLRVHARVRAQTVDSS